VSEPDTIAAIASPVGRGAVGIIRVSGADVPRIATSLLGELPAPRLARLARFQGAGGDSLDTGLALYFPAPASFTGEHVLELQGHGGVVVLDLVMRRLLELGCRPARAGEFSERAFLNGKMDIAQAEAVADLIDAGSSAAARAAVRSLQGEFSARIDTLQGEITELRAYVEVALDFPDEEVEFLTDAALSGRLERIFADFDSLAAAARMGALLREGLTVVIAGRPNAGKSSLLNALAGDDVAIVTALPGTTRDLLHQELELDGLPLHLIDTAGLRQTDDIVEAEGVRRARAEIDKADRVLYLVDASSAEWNTTDVDAGRLDASLAAGNIPAQLASDLAALPANVPVTLVFNKIDLTPMPARLDDRTNPVRLYISAKTGAGLPLLREHLKTCAGYTDDGAGALAARRRHLDALQRARLSVAAAAEVLRSTQAFELFAEELRLAQRALGAITGEFTSDDLLGEIFGNFCIGK
jgi:tRNA modification GTPase